MKCIHMLMYHFAYSSKSAGSAPSVWDRHRRLYRISDLILLRRRDWHMSNGRASLYSAFLRYPPPRHCCPVSCVYMGMSILLSSWPVPGTKSWRQRHVPDLEHLDRSKRIDSSGAGTELPTRIVFDGECEGDEPSRGTAKIPRGLPGEVSLIEVVMLDPPQCHPTGKSSTTILSVGLLVPS